VTQIASEPTVHVRRIERLRGELDRLGAASFLVTDLTNVRYLSGFESTNVALIVDRGHTRLVTDGRYREAARSVQGVELVESERQIAPFLGRRLAELAESPVSFEADTMTVAQHEQIAASGAELRPTTGVVIGLRALKDPEELEAIRRGARVLDEVLGRLAQEPFVGRTEADLAWWIERAFREEGADGLAFPVIVASGPNAALPHHHPGGRTIERGETEIVDCGALLDGYCTDCTRTFATGELPDDLRRAYTSVQKGQADALAAVRPGADGQTLDATARAEIEGEGFEMPHGLGHGVGIAIHELPVLSRTATATLALGNVVTVEPGAYLPGRGGIRIEDLVIVREDGPEVLTPFTKELLTVG